MLTIFTFYSKSIGTNPNSSNEESIQYYYTAVTNFHLDYSTTKVQYSDQPEVPQYRYLYAQLY